MDIFNELISKKVNGSKIEKDISNYILNYNDNYKNLTAKEIAQNVYTVNSTITKYIKNIGFDDFFQFKYELIEQSSHLYNENLKLTEDVIGKYTSDLIDILKSTAVLLNDDDLEDIAQKIIDSNKIYIRGIGSSSNIAREFKLKLYKLGFNVFFEVDEHLAMYQTNLVDENSIYINFTYSGPNKEEILKMENLKSKGAYVVLITSNKREYKGVSKKILVTYDKALLKKYFITSRLSLLLVSDLIVIKVKKFLN